MTAVAALLGLAAGWTGGAIGHLVPAPQDYPFLAEQVPLPHHVPRYPGGLSFRFAMAHDVIHERFPKHGAIHYRERDRIARKKLDTLAAGDPARFPLADDLAAGLDRLGRPNEAVEIIRDKLARQQAKQFAGRDLYTSYANLGTFLIHGSFKDAAAGDPVAQQRFREGIEYVRQSVVVNPEAHFGREQWQASIAEFLLAAMDEPGLLKTFDCLGNRLDLGIEDILNRESNWLSTGYGRPTDAAFSRNMVADDVTAFFRVEAPLDDPLLWAELSPIRKHITRVGAEDGWDAVRVPSHRSPVPFDEPVLGIIGMWRQGGGANPHFALALGEVLLRVGQRYIAWAAFERALRLSDRFWPDPALQRFLCEHCRKRQKQIEETLSFRAPASSHRLVWQYVSPPLGEDIVATLRPQFEAELVHGESYQHAYQEYEAAKIAAGRALLDEHFFDEFHAGHESIASPVGPEEWFVFVPRSKMYEYTARRRWAWGLFGAGLAATVMALWSRRARVTVLPGYRSSDQGAAPPQGPSGR